VSIIDTILSPRRLEGLLLSHRQVVAHFRRLGAAFLKKRECRYMRVPSVIVRRA
jgi:hypothetical protein